MKTVVGIYCYLVSYFLLSVSPANYSLKEWDAQSQCTYIFAHGLGNTHEQVGLFSRLELDNQNNNNPFWIIDGSIALFDFPDAKRENEYYNKQVTLGQNEDMQRLLLAYQETVSHAPQKDIAFIGVSRGAVTILNLMAQQQLNAIKAIVLESPFDTIKSVIKHILKRYHLSWLPGSTHLGFKIAQKYFPAFNPKGIFPIDVIDKIPQVPMLLIHSKKDMVIPIKSSRKLYIKLKELGHQDVYLLELSGGSHGKLLKGPYAQLYQQVAHAFWKKYNLPHDKTLAADGESYLSQCQPTVTEVQQRMQKKKLASNNTDAEA